MRLPAIALRFVPCLALLLAAAGPLQAAEVHSLRQYVDTLSDPYPAQGMQNEWTFHSGNESGALLPARSGIYYVAAPELYQQIGNPVNTGGAGCTSGFCPAEPANTRATFDGVFLHPGASLATTAVFRAHETVQLDALRIWSEMVVNGSNGNGLEVTVRLVLGGVVQDIDGYTFDYASTRTSKDERVYTPGLTLHDGDMVAFLFGNRGSYLYDHANIEIQVTTSDAVMPSGALPEPSAAWLVALGLGAAGWRASARRAGAPRR